MKLTKFKDELPRLTIAKPIIAGDTGDKYEVVISQVMHSFHSDMPQVPVWAYAGRYPGPVIEAQAGHATEIKSLLLTKFTCFQILRSMRC